MLTNRPEALSVHQAAQIIYGRSCPSEAQVRRVEESLERGEMKGTCCGKLSKRWMTTSRSVAEYMAHQAYPGHLQGEGESAAGQAQQAIARAQAMPSHAARHAAQLEATYQELLTDYFLAIVGRRRRRNASQRFQRAVVAGQVTLLLLIVASCLSIVNAFNPAPPEHRAIERYIAAQSDYYRIIQWHPMRPHPEEGAIVRVEYHYQNERGKGVDTDRTFWVDSGQVQHYDPDE